MLDDIDYSSLSASETPSEKKKDEGISSRRMKSEKTSKAAQAAPVDVNAVVQRSQQLSADLGAPKPADGLSNYGTEILGGLGVLGALAAAHHHYTTNRPKLGESNAGMPPPAKPDMRNFGQQSTAPTAPPEPKYSPEIQALIDRSEANKAAKAADAAAKANPVPQGMTPSIPTGQPNVPSNPAGAFAQPSGYGQTLPQTLQQTPPQPSLQQAVETGGDVGQALKADVAKMVDEASKPVAPVLTKKEQGMKNWLLNQYGGKDLPMAHEAYDQVKQILGYTPAYAEGSKGGSLLPEEKGKILDWRKESLPGPKVNLTHDMKKILKTGGPALAALIATTEFANAKTPEQKANAGINLLGAILPPGMDINTAGAPGVQQSQVSQAALLGSPYAQTEWAKNQRLRERAGAGRGIAPPSAYR